jgi:hypothetical protein
MNESLFPVVTGTCLQKVTFTEGFSDLFFHMKFCEPDSSSHGPRVGWSTVDRPWEGWRSSPARTLTGHGEGEESLRELIDRGLGPKSDILRPAAMNGDSGVVVLINAVVQPWRTTGCGKRS